MSLEGWMKLEFLDMWEVPAISLETLILSWNPSQKQMRDFLAMLYDF